MIENENIFQCSLKINSAWQSLRNIHPGNLLEPLHVCDCSFWWNAYMKLSVNTHRNPPASYRRWPRSSSLMMSSPSWGSVCYLQQSNLIIISMVAGRFEGSFRQIIFQLILLIDSWAIWSEIVLRWMPQDLTDAKPLLVWVMAWCHQAASHYLSQCWPRSLWPHGVSRPQWVKENMFLWLLNFFIKVSDCFDDTLWLVQYVRYTNNPFDQ